MEKDGEGRRAKPNKQIILCIFHPAPQRKQMNMRKQMIHIHELKSNSNDMMYK